MTIVLREEVARWLRVRAAENDQSVSRYVGELLGEMMDREQSYTDARAEFFSVPPRRLRNASESLPSREELYDRDAG